jgi:hypothetical protein
MDANLSQGMQFCALDSEAPAKPLPVLLKRTQGINGAYAQI